MDGTLSRGRWWREPAREDGISRALRVDRGRVQERAWQPGALALGERAADRERRAPPLRHRRSRADRRRLPELSHRTDARATAPHAEAMEQRGEDAGVGRAGGAREHRSSRRLPRREVQPRGRARARPHDLARGRRSRDRASAGWCLCRRRRWPRRDGLSRALCDVPWRRRRGRRAGRAPRRSPAALPRLRREYPINATRRRSSPTWPSSRRDPRQPRRRPRQRTGGLHPGRPDTRPPR
jgi:hypothetical protein